MSSHREKAQELSTLKQGRESVCDYAIQFRMLAAESGWNNIALYDIFLKGLSPAIQDLLVPLDLPTSLDELIALAIRTDNRRNQLRRQREPKPGVREGTIAAPEPRWRTASLIASEKPLQHVEEPMQLGRARLSLEERQKRQQEGRCFYCGNPGHLISSCPVKKKPTVSSNQVSKTNSRSLTSVTLNSVHIMEVMIDSGADESLMDWGLAHKLQLDSAYPILSVPALSMARKFSTSLT